MKRLYWCNETDSVITEDDVRESYKLFNDEYDSFPDYLSACMYYNNGSLSDLSSHIQSLKRDLNRGSADYYDDEKTAIKEEIKRLEKLYLEA